MLCCGGPVRGSSSPRPIHPLHLTPIRHEAVPGDPVRVDSARPDFHSTLRKLDRPLGQRTGILKKVYDIEPSMHIDLLSKDTVPLRNGRACSLLCGGAGPSFYAACAGHPDRTPA